MQIKDFLAPSEVILDLCATGKSGLLRELARRASAIAGLETEMVARELEKRDELGSTGIGEGVSIPHARLREIARPFGMLARLETPIEYDAIDGQPVDIVFLLLLPAASQLDQLNALAAAARKLRDRSILEQLRRAESPEDLYRAIAQ